MRVFPWILLLLLAPLSAQPNQEGSRCHIFVDYQFIWTLEFVENMSGRSTPILNIITFLEGEWDLRPKQIHISNKGRREAEIDKFSIDTGADEAYVVSYLKVRGDSFIGMDLIGDIEGFEVPREVMIDLGNGRFILKPVDCLEFETTAHKINQINFDSPDIRQDYDILGIELAGKREARRRVY